MRNRGLWLLSVALGVLAPLRAQTPSPAFVLPDPSEGEIDGRVAVALWPRFSEAEEDVLAPEGFSVHLVPAADLDAELVFPAGQWFQPPRGRYRYWVEGRNMMSRSSNVLSYGGGVFQGKGVLVWETLYPAGQVRLSHEIALDSDAALRVLHLDSHTRGQFLGRELSRRLPSDRLHMPILMPVGRVVAALFDGETRRYTSLSHPVAIHEGHLTEVLPYPPKDSVSHLIARLERPDVLSSAEDDDVEVVLDVPGDRQARDPDVLVRTATRLYAIWYDLSTTRARLHVRSESVFFEHHELLLRPGVIEHIQGDLHERLRLNEIGDEAQRP